jgi:hypothetical protein
MINTETRFRDHVAKSQEYSSLRLSEADTRAYVVDPLLRILGYDGIRDLRREVPVPVTKEAVDYQLMIDGQAQAIVEAKALRHSLTDQHSAQCVQYASILGVRWCLITNGITWAVYDAHAKGPLAEKRVAEVRLDGEPPAIDEAWAVLSSFSRDALAKASPLTNLLVERVVADELSSPDSRAVEALRRAVRSRFGERVSGQVVVGAIHQVMSRLGHREAGGAQVPLVNIQDQMLEELDGVEPSIPAAGQRSERAQRAWRTRQQDQGQASESQGRVTIADLIRAHLLPPDATLTARVAGVIHVGRVQDGQLEVNGQVYPTPSAASIAVRNVRSWNGWKDWHYDGHSLHSLRERMQSEGSAANSTAEES